MIDKLYDFVVNKNYHDLSEDVVEGAKDRLLDFLGCAFAGYEEKSSEILFRYINENSGNQECTIIGNGKTTVEYAALANGILGHSRELDDEHKGAMTHIGVVVIPAALGLGEKHGVDGKKLITSIVMGYEVAARIGMATRGEVLLAKGFHPTGVIGVFGSTAAASKILALDKETMMSAIGIAGSLASGLFEFVFDGSWTKRLHPGWASRNGIIAAMLASKGFTGPHSIIEGKFGFANVFSNGLNAGEILNDLGRSFGILEATYKPHACCSFIHPLIDAALEILSTNKRLDVNKIAAINCRIFSAAISAVVQPWEGGRKVNNTVDAQFNAFFSLAAAIHKGAPLLTGFAPEDLDNPAIINLVNKITIEPEESFDKYYPKEFPAEVKFRLVNGQDYIKKVRSNRGSPSWPMTRAEIESKFRVLSSSKCSSRKSEEIIQMVKNLSSVKRVENLCHLLRDVG